MENKSKISFHESTITQFYLEDDLIKIELEEIYADETKKNASITLTGIKKIDSDVKIKGKNLMAAPDGEVLTLLLNDHLMELLVEWNDFATNNCFTHYYKIEYSNSYLDIHR